MHILITRCGLSICNQCNQQFQQAKNGQNIRFLIHICDKEVNKPCPVDGYVAVIAIVHCQPIDCLKSVGTLERSNDGHYGNVLP